MKIALANLDSRIGGLEINSQAILEAARAAGDANVLVTPELAISGYPPRDLLLREGFVERCEQTVEHLARQLPPQMLVLVGAPRRLPTGSRCGNSLAICRDGEILGWADKRLLPGYDVFDDDRYFLPGEESILIEHADVKIGLLICEDLWQGGDVRECTSYEFDPVAELVEQGAELLVAASASPFAVGKHARQVDEIVRTARDHQVFVASVNRSGSEDDLVFDGSALLVNPAGEQLVSSEPFEGQGLLTADLADQAVPVPTPLRSTDHERLDALVEGVRGYLRKTGQSRVIVGLSGGIDSAVTVAIAAIAVGGENVLGVMMPSRHSSEHSRSDAMQSAELLQLSACPEISIDSIHQSIRDSITGPLGDDLVQEGSLTDQNLQARSRGIILMGISNARGGLVLSTGNKSEMAAGYATLYGDMCGALAVLGDVLKMDVYSMARWMNENHRLLGFEGPLIPEGSITKPPSAELKPDQLDEDSLPPYEVLDDIVRRWVEEEQCSDRIIQETGYPAEEVLNLLRMVDQAQFKREQAAVIPKVSRRAFGRGRPWPVIGVPGGTPHWIPAGGRA
ncbi:MAG: NAD+ synthase [Phycisphaerae bacterium]|nr:NAD+ synthase [Phycisphaerae bacterium]